MLFNSILSMYELFLITVAAFFFFFLFRHLCIKKKISILTYHIILFLVLLITVVAGGGVQNDAYDRLEKFIALEKNHKLNDLQQNLQNYDSMLVIDLQEFKNSDEFRAYLKRNDNALDKAEALLIGWIFVLISDIAIICLSLLRFLVNKIRNRFYS